MRTDSLAANTITTQIQQTNTAASLDTTQNGVAHFRSAHFSCTSGFISLLPQTSFSSYLSASVTNVTGDATPYTLIFDSTTNNVGTNYNTSTGVFTAPVTGLYQFNYSVTLNNLSVDFTVARFIFNVTDASNTPQQLVGFGELNPGVVLDAANLLQLAGSALVPMTAGWKAHISVIVSGSTKTVGVNGGAATADPKCSFSGFCVSAT
jgi:hypothetical protein